MRFIDIFVFPLACSGTMFSMQFNQINGRGVVATIGTERPVDMLLSPDLTISTTRLHAHALLWACVLAAFNEAEGRWEARGESPLERNE